MQHDEEPRFSVDLFTDGACLPNPGPGGWAFILKHPARSKEGSGVENPSTNNRMEIMAVIKGLEALKLPTRVALYSDSEYVVNAVNGWMEKWKRFGWSRSRNGKKPIKNVDLWRRLDELCQRHRVTAHWVRGHAGHAENERCDFLATEAAKLATTLPTRPAMMPPEPLPPLFQT
ncbi:MAG TPA: ribonuclease HI [Tepidisphaeraceae bacterium]|nr:ribonuclease HI [Tepidisphaeraceae bacterium]